jgi:hypothetical protein
MSAFGGKADMTLCGNPLLRSLLGVKRTCLFAPYMSANDPKRTLDATVLSAQIGLAVFVNLLSEDIRAHQAPHEQRLARARFAIHVVRR